MTKKINELNTPVDPTQPDELPPGFKKPLDEQVADLQKMLAQVQKLNQILDRNKI
jgi:hypothetical protein